MTGLLTRRFRLGTLVLGATVLALMIGIFILGGGRAAASHVLCGDVLVADTTLDSDLLLCPDDGLVIGADGITVDLDGFTISGDDGAVGDFGIDNTAASIASRSRTARSPRSSTESKPSELTTSRFGILTCMTSVPVEVTAMPSTSWTATDSRLKIRPLTRVRRLSPPKPFGWRA